MAGTVGLYVGKFAPYHRGHQYMITQALKTVDFLFVVCCEDKILRTTMSEEINSPRVRYIRYPYNPKLKYNYDDADESVSEDWADALQKVLPTIDYVFTSELYGKNFAKHLGAVNVKVDIDRKAVPISATEIRADLSGNWDYLTDISKKRLMKTFIICGGESTGKTTLYNRLKEKYTNFGFVPEVGREMCDSSKTVTIETLNKIVLEHSKRYMLESSYLPQAIVMDTDHQTTRNYARLLFNESLHSDSWIRNITNPVYIHLSNNIPHVQDGTRLDETVNLKLSALHHQRYSMNLNFNTITNRDEQVDDLITKHLSY